MRENGLLLELKLLENIWLERLLGLCDTLCLASNTSAKSDWPGCRLTSPQELDCAQYESQQHGVWQPVALGDGNAHDEQAGWDVDAIDVLLRSQRRLGSSHGGRAAQRGRKVGRPRYKAIRQDQKDESFSESQEESEVDNRQVLEVLSWGRALTLTSLLGGNVWGGEVESCSIIFGRVSPTSGLQDSSSTVRST